MKIDNFELKNNIPFYNGYKLKVRENSQGYNYVTIEKKGLRLHRLVAKKYIKNPENLPCVDHIDDDKNNNKITNLQWVSYSKNSKKAYEKNPNMKKMHVSRVKIKAEKDNIKYIFKSLRECSRYLKRDVSAVSRCLNGEWNKCNGYKLTRL